MTVTEREEVEEKTEESKCGKKSHKERHGPHG